MTFPLISFVQAVELAKTRPFTPQQRGALMAQVRELTSSGQHVAASYLVFLLTV